MIKHDDIFHELSYMTWSDYSETGLVLFIEWSDSMEILYNQMDIHTIESFITDARKHKDAKLVIPIAQFKCEHSNLFKIKNGIFSVGAYEGKGRFMEVFASPIETQLPFLEIICEAIIECINTKDMIDKEYFQVLLPKCVIDL